MLEEHVANRERLINDQDIRSHGSGGAERQSHLHSCRIGPDWLIHMPAQFRKFLNPGKKLVNLFFGKAKKLAGQARILPTGEVGMNTDAQLQKRRHLACHRKSSFGRSGCPRQQAQQGTLTRPVHTNDPQGFSGIDREADVPQGPIARMTISARPRQQLQKPITRMRVAAVGFPQADGRNATHQRKSGISAAKRR